MVAEAIDVAQNPVVALPSRCPGCGTSHRGDTCFKTLAWEAHRLARAAGLPASVVAPLPASIRFTYWSGGRRMTRNGEPRIRTFSAFASFLMDAANDVAPKGTFYFADGVSKNGRNRDQDCQALTLLTLDCDGAGPWDPLLTILRSLGLAATLQYSWSHTPEIPKWHATLARARPAPPPEKEEFRRQLAWTVGWLSGVAGFPGVGAISGAKKSCGFDLKTTNRLLGPVFIATRRPENPNASPPGTYFLDGGAFDFEAFLRDTGYCQACERLRAAVRDRGIATCSGAPSGSDQIGSIPSSPEDVRPLAVAFRAASWLGKPIAGGFEAYCPNHDAHTDGDGAWDAWISGRDGKWRCPHAACDGRKAGAPAFQHENAVAALPNDAREVYARAREKEGLARTLREFGAARQPQALRTLDETRDELRRTFVEIAEETRSVVAAAKTAEERDAALRKLPAHVFSVTTGGGKTSAAIDALRTSLCDFAAAYAAPTNDLVEQTRKRIGAKDGGAGAPRWSAFDHGIVYASTRGKGKCHYLEEARTIAATGGSIKDLLCQWCDHRLACRVYKTTEGKAGGVPLRVTNFALLGHELRALDRAAEEHALRAVLLDETPKALLPFEVRSNDLLEAVTALRREVDAFLDYFEKRASNTKVTVPELLYDEFFARGVLPFAEAVLGLFAVRAKATNPDDSNDPSASLVESATKLADDREWLRHLNAARALYEPPSVGPETTEPLVLAREVFNLTMTRRGEARKGLWMYSRAAFQLKGSPKWDALMAGLEVLRSLAAWARPKGRAQAEALARWSGYSKLTVTTWNGELLDALAYPGVVVLLDATPDREALVAAAKLAGRELHFHEFDVADATEVKRIHVYAHNGNRRTLAPARGPDLDAFAAPLADALRRVRDLEQETGWSLRRAVVSTFKPVADALGAQRSGRKEGARKPQDLPERLRATIDSWHDEGRELEFVYFFGPVKGMDTWKDCDVAISIGDPRPDLETMKTEATMIGVDWQARVNEHAAAALAQFFGRLRTPTRESPAVMLHYGQIVPAGWHPGNAELTESKTGRPAAVVAMTAEEFLAVRDVYGSWKAFSEATGIPIGTLKSYATGNRRIHSGVVERVQALGSWAPKPPRPDAELLYNTG